MSEFSVKTWRLLSGCYFFQRWIHLFLAEETVYKKPHAQPHMKSHSVWYIMNNVHQQSAMLDFAQLIKSLEDQLGLNAKVHFLHGGDQAWHRLGVLWPRPPDQVTDSPPEEAGLSIYNREFSNHFLKFFFLNQDSEPFVEFCWFATKRISFSTAFIFHLVCNFDFIILLYTFYLLFKREKCLHTLVGSKNNQNVFWNKRPEAFIPSSQ